MSAVTSFTGDHAFLSNFHPSTILIEGLLYPTVEHAFQAMKVTDMEQRATIAAAPTPSKAKYMGRSVALRPNWENIKVRVMLDCLRAKFACHPHLSAMLALTAEDHLEEGNDWGDRYWGTVNGQGQNMLGVLLMRVREERRWRP